MTSPWLCYRILQQLHLNVRPLRKTNRVPLRKDFAGIYMSLPQCIEGCPQHETGQAKTKAQIRNSQQNEFKRGGRVGAGESRTFREGCAQHESTQPLTLLPHKTQSKLQGKHSGFEGGQGGPGGPGLSRGGESEQKMPKTKKTRKS